MLGGERRVIEFLEIESQNQLGKPLLEKTDENRGLQKRSFTNFFFQPCVIGRDLFVIERFGLVQYVSR